MADQETNDKANVAYEAVLAFENEFDEPYTDVLGASHHCDRAEDRPDVMVDIVLDGVDGHYDGDAYGDRYTYKAVEFGRDHGLDVYDHVVYLGYQAEGYDTECAIKIRFGVGDDWR